MLIDKTLRITTAIFLLVALIYITTLGVMSVFPSCAHEWKEGAAGWKLPWGELSEVSYSPRYFFECVRCNDYATAGVPFKALRSTDRLDIYCVRE